MKEFERSESLTRADELMSFVQKENFNESSNYRVAYYGECDYIYTGANLKAKPFPTYLKTLAKQMEERENLPDGYFNMCLINKYANFKGLGKHRDNEPEITAGSTIASISLGAKRVFSITKGYNTPFIKLDLNHGDVVMMRGKSQVNYYHEVEKGSGIRYNITLRHNEKAPKRN
jgi:alkylated DNA repair dioxygenase AlkB